ncbi:hypothetical protein ANN_24531 [Periplaneta americana]|uniref:Uncharacterized protein n=1 Tax=Periplaneta americana TaxID=6978 RepID=A0ABQ8S3N6_PERAM|nr:hypothetical protein ANN_24531 [Periplaneta americana]
MAGLCEGGNGPPDSLKAKWDLWQHLKEGLNILLKGKSGKHQAKDGTSNSTAHHNSSCSDERCAYRFVLLDWFEELINTSNKQANSSETITNTMTLVSRWRPLLQIEASNKSTNGSGAVKQEVHNKTRYRSRFLLVPLVPLLKDWARIKEEGVTCEFADDDSCADSESSAPAFSECKAQATFSSFSCLKQTLAKAAITTRKQETNTGDRLQSLIAISSDRDYRKCGDTLGHAWSRLVTAELP